MLYFNEVLYVCVSDILDVLKSLGWQYIMVEDVDLVSGLLCVCGIFLVMQIGCLFGVLVFGFDLLQIFVEIEVVLVN